MYRSFLFSLLFHFLIILFIFVILPKFFSKKKNVEIAVDIISVEQVKPILKPKDIIIDKNSRADKDAILPDNKIRKESIPAPFSVPEKKVKKDLNKKELKKSKKQIIKPDPKIVAEGDKNLIDNLDVKDFDDDRKDIGEILKEVKRIQGEEKERINRERFIYGDNLTAIEESNIRKQVNYCWSNIINKIFLKEDVTGIEVKVKVSFDSDGFVEKVDFSDDMHEYMDIDNDIYRRIVDSVRSTFLRCKKITGMPKSKYKNWKELEFIFKPEPIN